MNQTDPRAQAAFDAAISHIKTTTAAVADRVSDHLGILASAAMRIFDRDALITAQMDLRRNMSTFVLVFGETMVKKVARELNPQTETNRRQADTDWQSLSLVDDAEMEEQMFSGRISQTIAHDCEWEQREVASYTGQLLGIGRAEQERNPLRADVLGAALYRAISSISSDHESRKLLARELGLAMARVMPTCYAEILRDFRARGIRPVGLSVRGVEGPGNELGRDRLNSGYDSLQREPGATTGGGQFGPTSHSSDVDSGSQPTSFGAAQAAGRVGAVTSWGRSAGFGNSGPGRSGGNSGYRSQNAAPAADAELMALIRRLTFLASRPGDLGGASTIQGFAGSGGGGYGGAYGAGAPTGTSSDIGEYSDGTHNLMAVNLIRAHREELRQASTGKLDHMVIDVVGSLFDQILSDPRVPPQMARQIARLQLPVLRVALSDNTFFSSRKHPARRFVNRIASLASAFEELDDGPGKQFMARVRDLVQEIVEGDFDQIEVYAAKLNTLESFVAQQAKAEVQANASAVSMVDNKESELRTQQRYMQQLTSALRPLAMQEYLRDFLAQVWSQALALATRREGPQSELVQRLKRAGRDLVMSVQPKGSPAMRKKFLMQLPPLMKDLNEGMRLIGWPEAAQKAFFGKLLPAHADSLKGTPLTELEYNLLAKQLEGVFATAVPEADALLRDMPLATTGNAAPEPQFTAAEAKQIGLVEESAVNWAGDVDIDLTAPTQPGELSGTGDTQPMRLEAGPGLDINLDLSPSEPAEPSRGAQLIDHVQLGFAYQMNLNDEWQKVRLSYVSPGRAFFVFTRGKRHHETVSLTSRMLSRMCETGRFRAFESAYLIERATARARKQLAELSAQSSKPA